jgi:alpha-D-ribose 1-methylphosphonate 5-triphosphate synthase subunit PhnI
MRICALLKKNEENMNKSNEHTEKILADMTKEVERFPITRPERILQGQAKKEMGNMYPLITQHQIEELINTKYPDQAD